MGFPIRIVYQVFKSFYINKSPFFFNSEHLANIYDRWQSAVSINTNLPHIHLIDFALYFALHYRTDKVRRFFENSFRNTSSVVSTSQHIHCVSDTLFSNISRLPYVYVPYFQTNSDIMTKIDTMLSRISGESPYPCQPFHSLDLLFVSIPSGKM